MLHIFFLKVSDHLQVADCSASLVAVEVPAVTNLLPTVRE